MRINVVRSAVLDFPIDRVWAVLRDFNSHELWHPAADRSRIENDLDGDVVGCVRRLHLTDGAELREQLLRHSDRDYSLAYCILDSPLPLFDHLSTVRLKPVTDGNKTFWDWRSQFRAPDDRARELENFVGRELFEAGFKGLRAFLTEQTAPSGQPVEEAEAGTIPLPVAESLQSRTVVVTAAGDPEVLQLRNVDVPAPGSRQVRIRQTAMAVNLLDVKFRRGFSADPDLPETPGVEGVGEIIDVGEQVNGLFTGDRVSYVSRTPGAYADVRCMNADDCLPLPDGISDIEASTLLKGATAALLFGRVFRAVQGRAILIRSIAGGLGHLLGQWARSMDLTVIGTVSTLDQARFIRDLGCDYPIVMAGDIRLPDEVMRITNGRGVDYLVHTGDTPGLEDALACLSRFGHLAVMDDRDGESVPLDLNLLKRRSLTVSAPVCFDYFDDRIYFQRLAHQFLSRIQNRDIIPSIETFPLSKAADAHKRVESRQAMGAVALTPHE